MGCERRRRQMGASLTSPLPHRPPTSVCNHLFAASDAPPLFRTHPITETNKKHHSMLAVGWNWSKKAAQQVNCYLSFHLLHIASLLVFRKYVIRNLNASSLNIKLLATTSKLKSPDLCGLTLMSIISVSNFFLH